MKHLSLCLAVSLLSGCSSFSNMMDVTNLTNYSNHKSVKVLEVPPDLDAPRYDKTYFTTVSDGITQTSGRVSDAVPLVDGSLAAPSVSQVRIVSRGNELVLQVNDDSLIQKHTVDALKSMGMTLGKSDQSTGVIDARDRSLVSDPESPIGAYLNRVMGKLNQGAKYKVSVSIEGNSGFITVRDSAGKPLSANAAKPVLTRLRKEYTAS